MSNDEKIIKLMDEVKERLTKVDALLSNPREGNVKINIEKITNDVFNKVMEKISKQGIGTEIDLMPADYILEKFQEKEIRRWEEKLEKLDEDEFKIGAFVIALNHQTTRKEILGKIFGSSFISGENYQEMTKKIDNLINASVLREDKKGRVYPNIDDAVMATLQAYNPTQEKINQIRDRILRFFIAKTNE